VYPSAECVKGSHNKEIDHISNKKIHNGLLPSSTVPSRIDAPRPTGLHSVNCTFVHSLDLTLYACTFIRLSGLTLVLTLTVIKCQFFILSGSLHDL